MKKVYVILFSFLFIINIVLCISVLKLKDQRKIPNSTNEIVDAKNCITAIMANTGLPFNPFQFVKTGSDTLRALEQFIDSPKLIFYYNEMSCGPCADSELLRLDSLSSLIGINNILLMTKSSSGRDLSLLLKANRLKFKTLFIESMQLPVARYSINYYFILDSEFRTKLFYVPSPNYESINKIYYSMVVDFFRSNK